MKNYIAQNVDIYNPKRQLKYAKMFDNIEKLFPVKESEQGNPLAIVDAADYPNQGILVLGKTIQNGTPTMSIGVDIQSVSGDVVIAVTNNDSTLSQSVTFPLSSGQKMYEGDYLADDGIHHKFAEKIFDGEKGVSKATDTRFILSVSNAAEWATTYSNYFANTSPQTPRLVGSNSSSQLWLWDTDSVFEGSVNALKAWIADKYVNGVPLKAVYRLRTESIEAYTSSQQKAWEKIKLLSTYSGITNVSATSDDLSPNLQISYKQNLDYRLTQIENAILASGANV